MGFKEVEKDGEIRKYAEELTTVRFDKRGQPIKEMVRFYVDEHIDEDGNVKLMAVKHMPTANNQSVGLALVEVDKDGKTIVKTKEQIQKAHDDTKKMLEEETLKRVLGQANLPKDAFTGLKQGK